MLPCVEVGACVVFIFQRGIVAEYRFVVVVVVAVVVVVVVVIESVTQYVIAINDLTACTRSCQLVIYHVDDFK